MTILLMTILTIFFDCNKDEVLNTADTESLYTMPGEGERHEGTWLQWPHHYEYDDGVTFRDRMDPTWVAMTNALVTSEKVHIIAYDSVEKDRISQSLTNDNVPLSNVDFFIFPTNDVWTRDNGPIFVRDKSGKLLIQDWGFNGWGGRDNYELDDPIPTRIGNAIGIQVIDLNSIMINEGGAVEMDGNGVLMASRSSILSQRPPNTVRNPGITQSEAEKIFTKYLGIKKFIWLDGWVNDPDDPTDAHIDGFARFANTSTIVTMNSEDLYDWGLSDMDISTLFSATNIDNVPYDFVYLPLTQNDVVTAYGKDLEYKGSYQNFYVANTVVLVPNYNDPNDAVANNIIQGLYHGRTVIGIDVRNLYEQGGMIHCVTQQQPQ